MTRELDKKVSGNPLGYDSIPNLLQKFALPSIVAMLVTALYNIVDQFFIGQSIGELGNAATNVAFPLTIMCIASALLFGIGGASNFNLSMGRGQNEQAVYYMGNTIVLLFGIGTLISLITEIFISPLLVCFGSPKNVLPLAKEYTRITAIGFPFLILTSGGCHLVRADGSPQKSMLFNISGAVINICLDALFIFKFHMGMRGAALATIIGQIVSAILVINYLEKCKTVSLTKEHLLLKWKYTGNIISLGAAPCFNQLAMMLVQIVLNNSLKYYGGQSVYGESIPLACAGIIMKVNQIYFSVCIGLSQGLQPIVGYNYGAKKYERVKKAIMITLGCGMVVSCLAFLCFQTIPRQIISIFGKSDAEEYFQFAVLYFRVFLFATFINFAQPIISNCFTAIGKPVVGIFLSLTRQILFLLPLILILPRFLGINGILYAGPIADMVAASVAIFLLIKEWQKMKLELAGDSM